jgi:hypothetical protein
MSSMQQPRFRAIRRKIKAIHQKVDAYPFVLKLFVALSFIIYGVFAFITPFTPASWLALIGLELLGIRSISHFYLKEDEEAEPEERMEKRAKQQ